MESTVDLTVLQDSDTTQLRKAVD